MKTKYGFKKTPEGKFKVVKNVYKSERERTDDNIGSIIKNRIAKEYAK